MKSRSEIKLRAKSALSGNVFKVWLVIIILGLIESIILKIPEWLGIDFFVGGGTNVIKGFKDGQFILAERTTFGKIWTSASQVIAAFTVFATSYYCYGVVKGIKITYAEIWNMIKKNAISIAVISLITIALSFVSSLSVSRLVSILLSIVEIVVTFGLVQTNFVMIENPGMEPLEVIKKSWDLMDGYKFDYFVFVLSFIGWFFACILIIPILYVIPLLEVSLATYYLELREAKDGAVKTAE